MAINHNAQALALHGANHPDTRHLNSNIWDVEPIAVTRGQPVGLLWASPDCKHFSKAKGAAPRDRNIRDLAWVVVKWAEQVKPDVILMENVEEFLTWGPIGEEGQPIKEFAGMTFELWVKRLRKAGYKVQWRELRGCDYGAPTIRKRFFMVARRDGRKVVWPKPSHGDPKSTAVKSGRLKPWRSAAECIDWSRPCPSIFDTKAQIKDKHGLLAKRLLAANTMARIARGMKRYVIDAERPFLVNLTHGTRCEDLAQPFRTITGAHRGEKALVAPSITRFNGGATGQDMRAPLATVTANSWIKKPGGAAPLGMISPFLASIAHGESGGRREYPLTDPYGVVTAGGISHALVAPHLLSLKGTARRDSAISAPHPTVLAGGGHSAIVAPILTYAQQGGSNRSPQDPHHTITASPKDQNAVIIPTIVGCGGRAAQSRPRSGSEPLATLTAKADTCLAAASLVQVGYGERRGQAPRALDLQAPLSTAVAGGIKHAPIAAFLAQHHTGVTGHDARDPLSTIAATGSHQTPIAAWFAKYYGTGDGARTDDPMHTVTVKDRMGHMQADLVAPPFTEDHHARAREVADFLRTHDAWDDREFVTLEIDGETFVIVDIGMRMLTPRELFNAQGFPRDYVIEGVWDMRAEDPIWKPFTKDVQVSCCGNSVCPDLAEALAAANCGHLKEGV